MADSSSMSPPHPGTTSMLEILITVQHEALLLEVIILDHVLGDLIILIFNLRFWGQSGTEALSVNVIGGPTGFDHACVCQHAFRINQSANIDLGFCLSWVPMKVISCISWCVLTCVCVCDVTARKVLEHLCNFVANVSWVGLVLPPVPPFRYFSSWSVNLFLSPNVSALSRCCAAWRRISLMRQADSGTNLFCIVFHLWAKTAWHPIKQ